MPIAIKDWTGTEISRVYTDQWGTYNGLTYSTWEVNPPNPTGYAPTMMVTCMNDPGTGATPDPLFNPEYSQFCYEIPFMPGQTQYMDTPVVPTSAFAGAGYNNPDCSYPDVTPAISEVDGDQGLGPWVAGTTGHTTLTIHALGDQASTQQCILRARGHCLAIQPEDRAPPLWLWRYKGNRHHWYLFGACGQHHFLDRLNHRPQRAPHRQRPPTCRSAPCSSKRNTEVRPEPRHPHLRGAAN